MRRREKYWATKGQEVTKNGNNEEKEIDMPTEKVHDPVTDVNIELSTEKRITTEEAVNQDGNNNDWKEVNDPTTEVNKNQLIAQQMKLDTTGTIEKLFLSIENINKLDIMENEMKEINNKILKKRSTDRCGRDDCRGECRQNRT